MYIELKQLILKCIYFKSQHHYEVKKSSGSAFCPSLCCLPPSCLISLHHCGHISPGHEAVMHSSLHQGMNFWSWIPSSLNIIIALNAMSILVVFYTHHMLSWYQCYWSRSYPDELTAWFTSHIECWSASIQDLRSQYKHKNQSEEIPYTCSQSLSMTVSWDSQELQSDGCFMGCSEPLGNTNKQP